jgi:outer membrane receptor for monomeric catechols
MRIISLFTALLFSATLLGQKGSISGSVNDNETKTPIAGVNINLPRDKKTDFSDAWGIFRLSDVYPGQYELVLSHIGYKTEVIPVEVKENSQAVIKVDLKKSILNLAEIKIEGKKNTAANTIGAIDIKLRPVNNSQDILRIVPGLFIAQHAGGGKAEQIFLRGYDIDHGTDINITVDGMPANMVSHAHGQGYADMHFLIPETVEKVNFDKGPYTVNKGNLATAGFVEFNTKEALKDDLVKLEAGNFNTQRAVALLKIFNKQNEKTRQQFYIASEYFKSDGYVESPQDFHRFNIFGKYNAWYGNNSQLTITASAFDSKWNASGQIPDRAVRSGMISRFESIDNTEGGNTNRHNFNIRFAKQLKKDWHFTDQLYYSRYGFNLYSNFTFFLNDPVNGDMINQRETRNIYGTNKQLSKTWMLENKKAVTDFGAGFRYDDVNDIQLNSAVKRQYRNTIQHGDLNELNAFAYWNQNIELTEKLNINGGLRFDHFNFAYKNKFAGETDFSKQAKSLVSPKLNISYSISSKMKLFLNNGIGFHSNDTRVILDNSANEILPKVFSTDLGFILKPSKNLILKTIFWHSYSEQEFVYVGDAGIVEAGGKSRRIGIDFSGRYQITSWLFADADINLTKPTAIGEAKGENYIPLAPKFTSIGGLTAKIKNGFNGSIRYRLIGDRPANETNSVNAEGYFLLDAVLSYQLKKFEFFVSAENLLDAKWKEAQFDTESRLQFEPAPVSEIHYTPGTPLFIKAGISFRF